MKFQNTIKLLALISLGILVLSGTASALLIGGPDIIAAPATVEDDTTTNDHQQGFNEQQNVFLEDALEVDDGVFIAAGTWVSSHMIFLNTQGGTRGDDTQTWLFDNEILGVMSDSGGTLEAASSGLLGAPGTTYPGAFPARGLEGNDFINKNNDYYVVNDDMLELRMVVTEPGDWIRVITAASPVPEPGTIILMGAGLLGLVGFRKKFIK